MYVKHPVLQTKTRALTKILLLTLQVPGVVNINY